MNKINKNSFKIVAIFIGVAVATMILIMAGTYLAQRFDKGEPDGGSPEVVEDVVKNDDKTASMEYSGYITINTEEEYSAFWADLWKYRGLLYRNTHFDITSKF